VRTGPRLDEGEEPEAAAEEAEVEAGAGADHDVKSDQPT
jgi:hypothetical protein